MLEIIVNFKNKLLLNYHQYKSNMNASNTNCNSFIQLVSYSLLFHFILRSLFLTILNCRVESYLHASSKVLNKQTKSHINKDKQSLE